jgi:hypothetical protein
MVDWRVGMLDEGDVSSSFAAGYYAIRLESWMEYTSISIDSESNAAET